MTKNIDYLKMADVETRASGKWYGVNDHTTSVGCYYYEDEGSSPDIHPPQFEAVCQKLNELANVRDKNGDVIVQIAYYRPDWKTKVIAYRFTSDWAYRNYNSELQACGSSLGRGCFNPFNANSYDFEHFCKK